MKNARQHFHRRRLARAVRSDEADEFTCLDLKGDAFDCYHLHRLAMDEGFEGTPNTRSPTNVRVGPAERFHLDDRLVRHLALLLCSHGIGMNGERVG